MKQRNRGTSLEDAIAQMREKNVGVLPVLEDGALIGIITNNDIFDAFLKITGYYAGGTRVSILIKEDHPGILAEITKLFANHGLSILTIVVNRVAQGQLLKFKLNQKNQRLSKT